MTSLTPPAGRVDLAHADRVGLEQLLEHDPVVDVLAGGHPDRRHGTGDRGVAEDVVRARRLLDPVRVELGEGGHPRDRLADVPALVRVDRHHRVGADLLADDARASAVIGEIRSTLSLNRVQPSASASRQRRRILSSS